MKYIPKTIWLTGLSASGKSTLAQALHGALHARGVASEVLDGDIVRQRLSADLGFSREDRAENIRRVALACRQLNAANIVAIAALISPYRKDREMARHTVGEAHFVEVHLRTSLAVCEARDPKGLYQRARRGEIAQFTGISDPYEEPTAPMLSFDTVRQPSGACVAALLETLTTA